MAQRLLLQHTLSFVFGFWALRRSIPNRSDIQGLQQEGYDLIRSSPSWVAVKTLPAVGTGAPTPLHPTLGPSRRVVDVRLPRLGAVLRRWFRTPFGPMAVAAPFAPGLWLLPSFRALGLLLAFSLGVVLALALAFAIYGLFDVDDPAGVLFCRTRAPC